MKTTNVALIALACAGLSPLYGEKTGKAEGIKNRPSHQELAGRMAKRSNPLADHNRVKPLGREEIEKKKKRDDLGSLVQRSSILAYSGHWTLVPKGAILHVPPAFKNRVSAKPVGELLPWKEFLARNRGWIFTQPVQMKNARGEKALSENVLKNHRQLGRVVVAVLHHGPISVVASEAPKKK